MPGFGKVIDEWALRLGGVGQTWQDPLGKVLCSWAHSISFLIRSLLCLDPAIPYQTR